MARKDVLDRLSTRHDVAVRDFLDVADELDDVARQLKEVAAVSDEEATRHALRAGTARSQAARANRRSDAIRSLLS